MATVVEKQKQFEKDIYEAEKTQALIQKYTDLLTTNVDYAASQYQAASQQAASQASYDISGAYANYLKQQKNIMSQSGLESGYKEEVGSELQSAYGGAYQQAKATEASSLATAQSKYAKDFASATEEYNKNLAQLESDVSKEAKLRASIHSAAEQFAFGDLSGDLYGAYGVDGGEGIYTTKEGVEQLTDLGYDKMAEALLQGVGGKTFEQYLEEEGMLDELDYYLSADETGATRAFGLRKDLFGITETAYDATSEESKKRRYGTEGYIENVITPQAAPFRPTITMDYNLGDLLEGKLTIENRLKRYAPNVEQYADKLGLTSNEVTSILGGKSVGEYIQTFIDDIWKMSNSAVRATGKDRNQLMKDAYEQMLQKLEQGLIKIYRG